MYRIFYLLLLVMSAAAAAQDAEPRTLEGNLWQLESYRNAEGAASAALPTSHVTIEFSDGSVAGNATCNSYFGSYTTDGSSIEFSAMGSTMMACAPESLMQQEIAYLAALSDAAAYTIDNDVLQIMDADGAVVLTFSILEPAPLAGTTWVMTAYNNGQGGFVNALADRQVTLIFGADDQVSGSAGCNGYGGSYSVDGKMITLSEMMRTLMACLEPDGVMAQEDAYLAALAEVATYTIRGNTLDLKGSDGATLARFVARPVITGVEWQWQSAMMPDGTISDTPNPENYTLRFNDDGSFSIRADCNRGSGSYSLIGTRISIEVGPLTRMACPPESLSQAFLDHLAAVTAVEHMGDSLVLSPGTDGAVLVFAAS